MKYTRLLTMVLLALAAWSYADAADSGVDIMRRCASKFSDAKSINVDFAIAHSNGSDKGTLTMSKKLFRIETPALSIWFDGKTQWTYMAYNDEVNVTEPTGEELMESNPFEVISLFSTHFNCRELQSSPSNNIVELTPKNQDMTILSAKISISKSTGWPTAMTIVFDGGNTTSVSISKVTTGNSLPASQFRYDSRTHPNAEIIDLR